MAKDWKFALKPELDSTPVVSFPLFTDTTDYKEYTGTSWEVVDDFSFDGTDTRTPTRFEIVGSRDGTSGTAYCRLYDYTNSQVIAEISWTATAEDEYQDTSLQNLPATNAILEIQVKTDGGDSARIHSAGLY